MSIDWNAEFDTAVKAYRTAVYRADLPPNRREAAARDFRALTERAASSGAAALAVLEKALIDQDAYCRNAAARMLTGISDPRAQTAVLGAATRRGGRPLNSDHLRRVSDANPLLELIAASQPAQRAALVAALLRRPTAAGGEFVVRALSSGAAEDLRAALPSIGRWGDRELLGRVLNAGSASVPEDIRVDAAFQLALTGDPEGVARLETDASGSDVMRAAEAALRLAWLAWPGAISPISSLMTLEDSEAVGLSLNAAAALRAAKLGQVLLNLAQRPSPLPGEIIPLRDEALRVLADLTGATWPADGGDAVIGGAEQELTASARAEASGFYARSLARLDPGKRFRLGEPLTLAHLAADLLSPHAGPKRAAAHNLRAITGEDYGFDPDDDLIGNLVAIEAWRARAARATPLEPGGWAFADARLPGPRGAP